VNNRILLVDDEANLLQSLRRNLRRYDVTLAEGGAAGLEQLRNHGPFAVVVSDMQMPEVDGLTLLKNSRTISPDTVRIMLTGNVDQKTAVDAVNSGAIFRFVNKPCETEKLAKVLDEGLRQYDLVAAEKQLLSKTLTGSVTMITELMALANPEAFGRGGRMRTLARRVAERLEWRDVWQYEIAAMLSQIACMGAPKSEQDVFDENVLKNQAKLSGSIVDRIPRLEDIAAMIGGQYTPEWSEESSEAIQNGAKLLCILCEYDLLHSSLSASQTIRKMEANLGSKYDAPIFEAFSEVLQAAMELRSLQVCDLLEGMLLEENVLNRSGDILISKGHELTESLIQRLTSFSHSSVGVREPIAVRCVAANPVNSRKPDSPTLAVNESTAIELVR
jgi:CheY-like chemotaxis protein